MSAPQLSPTVGLGHTTTVTRIIAIRFFFTFSLLCDPNKLFHNCYFFYFDFSAASSQRDTSTYLQLLTVTNPTVGLQSFKRQESTSTGKIIHMSNSCFLIDFSFVTH